jgi:hypothetical protein
MNSLVRSGSGAGRPPVAPKPRSISFAAPSPTILRMSSKSSRTRPCRFSMSLTTPHRSGALSTSVPSRSKTMAAKRGVVRAGI